MRIGEVAAASGVTTKALRFYEERGLLPYADRSTNGYRDYPEETISRIEFIRRSQVAGLALAEILDILRIRDAGNAPCGHVRDQLSVHLKNLDQQIAELTALRESVAGFYESAAAGDPDQCNAERICSYL
ncbi:heavy metal-responsive transcriptional regulator [Arthrobacter sp. H20]|uniref:heavy metal-responsive transcriptional regulator n=1 Tax=Arthrobacter sp. H20 TaxID=1267981 RepID=UPI0004799282|nr:heavy metal-responsive transcriptional regulator [Arthrobacter sp. H20]